MKAIKRGLVVFLILALFIPLTAQASSAPHFPDVPDDAPYADAVNTLADMGIVKGDENGNFNPDSTITRAEFATMMCRVLGVEDQALTITQSSFTDVPVGHWACGYITEAVNLGLVNGYGDGRFGPSDTLTYQQAVKVLVCAWGYGDDAIMAGGWPDGYISVANDLGFTQGTATSASDIPRSIVAILIYNALKIGGNSAQ